MENRGKLGYDAMNNPSQTIPSGSNRVGRFDVTPPICLFLVLYHQHEQQLSAADLRSFNDERTAFAQVRVGLEQNLFLFVELEVQRVTRVVLAASIDLQREIFAVSEPILLTG